jgi:hypothetical protein
MGNHLLVLVSLTASPAAPTWIVGAVPGVARE